MIRTAVIIIILAVIALLSWRFKQAETVETAATAEPVLQSDFFLENFRMRQYGENGQLRYRLDGLRLDSFPATDSTLISHPDMVFHNDSGPNWRITATNGEASSEELDEIRLAGNVEITRDASRENPPLKVTTSGLLLKPKTEFVQSEAAITFIQPGARVVAQSLEGHLQQGQFKLRKVQGRYEP